MLGYHYLRIGLISGSGGLKDEISRLLQQHGVKPTSQRLEIGRVILSQPCHLSAEQVISRLRAAGSGVSKATVYNTLNLFSRQGMLREIAVDPSRMVYDSTTSPHHHFYNEDTGELIDIDPAELQIGNMPGPPEGTVEQSRELVVRIRNRTR